MIALGIALVVGGLVFFAAVLRHQLRKTRRPDDADYVAEDLPAPHAGWIDQHELDRLVNAMVDDAHRAYDEYRGEVR